MSIITKRAKFWKTSDLNLIEVPLNISGTRFQCSTDDGELFHQEITLRVKGE